MTEIRYSVRVDGSRTGVTFEAQGTNADRAAWNPATAEGFARADAHDRFGEAADTSTVVVEQMGEPAAAHDETGGMSFGSL